MPSAQDCAVRTWSYRRQGGCIVVAVAGLDPRCFIARFDIRMLGLRPIGSPPTHPRGIWRRRVADAAAHTACQGPHSHLAFACCRIGLAAAVLPTGLARGRGTQTSIKAMARCVHTGSMALKRARRHRPCGRPACSATDQTVTTRFNSTRSRHKQTHNGDLQGHLPPTRRAVPVPASRARCK